ncbi:hypothetical protein [Patulibacter sp.]|uniref:hypothetical protein n=1 Tax=Patulibacter sp. TaxID=1912859 RepID=UPI002715F988|nr:hypothetical protein [Patulibacter sp.]MDO9408885.1 hypothetical protein [Patulibacter sp.]
MAGGTQVVVATVVADLGRVGAAAAGDVADALLGHPEVSTVRVAPHEGRAVYRIDVPADDDGSRRTRALAPVRSVATALGLSLGDAHVTVGGTGDADDAQPGCGCDDRAG